LRFRGAAVETYKLDAEIDATDQLEFPDRIPMPSSSALRAMAVEWDRAFVQGRSVDWGPL